MLRKPHDLTAGHALAADRECVLRGDAGPFRTIFSDGLPVAFIDGQPVIPATGWKTLPTWHGPGASRRKGTSQSTPTSRSRSPHSRKGTPGARVPGCKRFAVGPATCPIEGATDRPTDPPVASPQRHRLPKPRPRGNIPE